MIRPLQRIAYLGQMADISSENGISKKIAGQAAHWIQRGHEVRYFSLASTEAIWAGLAPLEAELIPRGNAGQRILRSFELARRIRAWRPDIIYFRYAYHSAGLPRLFHEIPTVAEINSDDLTEYPITLSPAKVLYHRLTRHRVLRAITGFVPVTHEIGSRLGSFAKPTEVIANGIALTEFMVSPPPQENPPRLFFVGSHGTPWHGLERLTEIARLFPNVIFDVVGTESVPAPQNVTFHGPLPRQRYEPLLHASTAAIGTLALFKKKMNEACPLKVREYLALGLPVIAAYSDTDVPADADYFLRLPNSSAPLLPLREDIAGWLERWRTRRVPRAAIAHLDNGLKESRRLAFLARIVAANSAKTS